MELLINKKGNGACPLCTRQEHCTIQHRFLEFVKDVKDESGRGMEIVIYTCPHFKERS